MKLRFYLMLIVMFTAANVFAVDFSGTWKDITSKLSLPGRPNKSFGIIVGDDGMDFIHSENSPYGEVRITRLDDNNVYMTFEGECSSVLACNLGGDDDKMTCVTFGDGKDNTCVCGSRVCKFEKVE